MKDPRDGELQKDLESIEKYHKEHPELNTPTNNEEKCLRCEMLGDEYHVVKKIRIADFPQSYECKSCGDVWIKSLPQDTPNEENDIVNLCDLGREPEPLTKIGELLQAARSDERKKVLEIKDVQINGKSVQFEYSDGILSIYLSE